MKKPYIVVFSVIIMAVLTLSGCTTGAATQDITKVQNDLTKAQNQVTVLETQVATDQSRIGALEKQGTEYQSRIEALETQVSEYQSRIEALELRAVAFSAYNIWYDQYSGSNNYEFADSATFITEFGGVIEYLADDNLQASWNNYISTEKPLRDYLAELPADQSTWTDTQTSHFNELTATVYDALHSIGKDLLSIIWNS